MDLNSILTLGLLASVFTYVTLRSARTAYPAVARHFNLKARIPYGNPDVRLEVLDYLQGFKGDFWGKEVMYVIGGELTPSFWFRFIRKWREVRPAGSRMVVIFGTHLNCEADIYRNSITKRDNDSPFKWAECHPVTQAAFGASSDLPTDDDGIDLLWKIDQNLNETHLIILNNDPVNTVLVEDPHGREPAGSGILWRKHKKVYENWLKEFEKQRADRNFCLPFNAKTCESLRKRVKVEDTHSKRYLGTLAAIDTSA